MSRLFSRLRSVVSELKRRKVYRVAATYVVVAFVGFQAAKLLIPSTVLPPWTDEFFLFLLIIGFPVAVVVAWAFELTPEGVRRTETAQEEGSEGAAYPWVGLVVVVFLAGGVWYFTAGDGGEPSAQIPPGAGDTARNEAALSAGAASRDRPFVAVLPLENLSPSEENAFFADGIHEEILGHLSKVSGLGVFGRTTMRRYADTDRTLYEIGRELNAQAVLEGSVRRADGRVRISAQLIDPESRDHLWSNTYERRLSPDAIFDIQTDVARKVSEALETTLTPGEERRIERRPTESLTAYDLFLKGREAADRATVEGNDEAIRLLRQAVTADSSFALAWAHLATSFAVRVHNYGKAGFWADSALAAARRALELDPELDDSHHALATTYFVQGRLRRALEKELEAVKLDPNQAAAIHTIGVYHYYLGRLDEAVSWYRRAIRLRPNSSVTRGVLVLGYAALGDPETATAWLQQTGDTATATEWLRPTDVLDPEAPYALWAASRLALARGKPDLALERTLRRAEIDPESPDAWDDAARFALYADDYGTALRAARKASEGRSPGGPLSGKPPGSVLGYALMKEGQREEGEAHLRAVLDQAQRELERGSEFPQLRWEMGALHAALGDRDEAITWLERGYEAGYRWLLQGPRHDPMLDPVREDPRFQRIMADLEADVNAMRERVIQEERQAGLRGS